ncbi:cyclin family protein [Striga asiatica]|uniref:Cyclin family protein n=1 Tax=Striga asiatica TaxID=4170 RepID=A0A5A7PFX1_STRAF|nr:cyclin family protein [Striga asiatica]
MTFTGSDVGSTAPNGFNLQRPDSPGNICKRDVLAAIESDDKIVDVDENLDDPQSLAKKRPAINFIERGRKDINAILRVVLINWLVERDRLVTDTMYLTVNNIDHYLSGNVMDRQKVAIAWCGLHDDCVPQMESDVLNYLKFEMRVATNDILTHYPFTFHRSFVRAAHGLNECFTYALTHLNWRSCISCINIVGAFLGFNWSAWPTTLLGYLFWKRAILYTIGHSSIFDFPGLIHSSTC